MPNRKILTPILHTIVVCVDLYITPQSYCSYRTIKHKAAKQTNSPLQNQDRDVFIFLML